VTGAGGNSGKASYSATKGRPRLSTGTLSGSFAVTMAAIGRVTRLAGGASRRYTAPVRRGIASHLTRWLLDRGR
jgi:hypothetical protein